MIKENILDYLYKKLLKVIIIYLYTSKIFGHDLQTQSLSEWK